MNFFAFADDISLFIILIYCLFRHYLLYAKSLFVQQKNRIFFDSINIFSHLRTCKLFHFVKIGILFKNTIFIKKEATASIKYEYENIHKNDIMDLDS